jgi:hypothetical protein
VPPQLVPELVINRMRVARDAFSQAERHFIFFGEIAALLKIRQVLDLLLAPPVPSRLDGMGGQSILAPVDLAGADEQQLF